MAPYIPAFLTERRLHLNLSNTDLHTFTLIYKMHIDLVNIRQNQRWHVTIFSVKDWKTNFTAYFADLMYHRGFMRSAPGDLNTPDWLCCWEPTPFIIIHQTLPCISTTWSLNFVTMFLKESCVVASTGLPHPNRVVCQISARCPRNHQSTSPKHTVIFQYPEKC